MERITRFRASVLIGIVLTVLLFFAGRTYYLQIIETGGVIDNTTVFITRTRVKAARGDILDRNGNLLVSNRASYDLVINHYVINSDDPNTHLYKLVQMCKDRGVEHTDHFPVTETKPFTYTLEDMSSTWRNYFQAFLEARGPFDSDISAPLLIEMLRESYRMPEEWSDEDARLVIGIRYELSLRTLDGSTLGNYIFISDVASDDLAAIVELNVPGMNVEASTVREYNTTYAAHVLGYVGKMTPEQWAEYKNVDADGDGHKDYMMDAEVGQDGFEKAFEEYLHGEDAWRVDYVTTDGTVIRSYYENDRPPRAGNNVEVTIDLNLQITAEDALAQVLEDLRAQPELANGKQADGKEAEGGAVVAMDVRTGQILVCASYPTYDPSQFHELYSELLTADFLPLNNRALTFAYPPGSTYKMSTAIAAIDHDEDANFTSQSIINTKGKYDKYEKDGFVGNCLYYTQNWGLKTHGEINTAQALSVSCNWFFFELGSWLKNDESDPVAKGLGLGESTGVELYENIGHRANLETKKKIVSNRTDANIFYTADRLQSAIGQGYNAFTPLQLCVYTATLANQGVRYRATFLNRVVSPDYRTLVAEQHAEVMSYMEISDDAHSAYLEGMKMVATEGTARKTFANYPISIAAKTGTAETGIKGQDDNGAFVGFAPADNPQIAIAVYCEKAGHGSTVAAIAKEIFDVYFDIDEVSEVIVTENRPS